VATSADGVNAVTLDGGNVTLNQWHHIVALIGAGAITIYLDGAQVATTAGPVPLVGSNAPVRFGRDGDGNFFGGQLQDAAVYGYLLSSQQIANHYALRTMNDATVATAMAADASGHGRTGTYGGRVTLATGAAVADSSRSALFDGVTGAMTIGSVAPFKLATQSVEFWLKRPANGGGPIVGRWDESTDQRSWLLSVDGASGQLVVKTSTDGVAIAQMSGGSISANVWPHVVVATNGGSVQAFVDGASAFSGSGAVVFDAATGPLRVGVDGSGRSYAGGLADVAIYSTALTAQQVSDHYAHRSVAGLGVLTYTASPNTVSVERTGTLTVAGQTVSITQDAAPCVATVTPGAFTFDASAHGGTV